MVADVVVENASYSFDIPFSYRVPGRMEGQIRPGCRVLVPFGRSNRSKQGLVLHLQLQDPQSQQLKPIKMLLDQKPLLGEEQLWLLELLHQRTFCTYYEGLRALVPSGLTFRLKLMCSLGEARPQQPTDKQRQLLDYLSAKKKPVELEHLLEQLELERGEADFEQLLEEGAILLTEQATEKIADSKEVMVRKSEDCEQKLEGVRLTPARKKVLALLEQTPCASLKELCYYAGTTRQTLDKMEKAGLLCYYGRQVFRSPYADREEENPTPVTLNPSQQQALDGLWEQWQRGEGSALLYGVTGSGKTRVIIECVRHTLQSGRSAIVLIPEIGLTAQAVSRYRAAFGDRLAVIHSMLSDGERADAYRAARAGDVGVVLGTRSAVFAPLQNLGLIAIDEEQEHTYKSEMTPRYHARDIARFRCGRDGALMLLASATPSVESYYKAQRGVYTLVEMDRRATDVELPEVSIVDVREDERVQNRRLIGERLSAELAANTENGEQSILFVNRRGYNSFLSCQDCGSVVTCPNCSVSLTHHLYSGEYKKNEKLICHYCGYTYQLPKACPACEGTELVNRGFGTEKIEDDIKILFPEAAVARMDLDTTRTRSAYEKIIADFEQGKTDILIGTQMVSKGLDFDHVSIVGILNADTMLNYPDFRSYERAFQLMAQVAGRAGRKNKRGRVILQTKSIDHPIIHQVIANDYEDMVGGQLAERQMFHYPPYYRLVYVYLKNHNESLLDQMAAVMAGKLRAVFGNRVLGPDKPPVARIQTLFIKKIVVKIEQNAPMGRARELLLRIQREMIEDERYKSLIVYYDVDPM